MKRIVKMVAITSALVIILVVSIGSVVMADGPNPEPETCPNTDCLNVCPNPDCPCDGDQFLYRHQNGLQSNDGSMFKHQYRSCQAD